MMVTLIAVIGQRHRCPLRWKRRVIGELVADRDTPFTEEERALLAGDAATLGDQRNLDFIGRQGNKDLAAGFLLAVVDGQRQRTDQRSVTERKYGFGHRPVPLHCHRDSR